MRVNIDGVWRAVGLERLRDSPRYILTLEDRVIEMLIQEEGQAFSVQVGGRAYEVETSRQRIRRARGEQDRFEDGRWALVSPLTGVVTELLVRQGEVVARGQPLLVIEAMKMLNEMKSRVSGVVVAIHVGERDRVEIGQRLLELAQG